MATCKKCGAELEQDAKVCAACGAPVEEPPKKDPENESNWIQAEKGKAAAGTAGTAHAVEQNDMQTPVRKATEADAAKEEEQKTEEKGRRVRTTVLIAVLLVAVVVGGALLWNYTHNNENYQKKQQQRSTQVGEDQETPVDEYGNQILASDVTKIDTGVAEDNRLNIKDNQLVNNWNRKVKGNPGLVTSNGLTNFINDEGRVEEGLSGVIADPQGRQWFVSNGQVQYGYTGTVTDNGKVYRVRYGEVVAGPYDSETMMELAEAADANVKFNDYEIESNQYFNDSVNFVGGQVVTGLSTVKYASNGEYAVSFYIANGTDSPITLKTIKDFQLLDENGHVLSEARLDDLAGDIVEANGVSYYQITLPKDRDNKNHKLQNLSINAVPSYDVGGEYSDTYDPSLDT